MKDRFQRVFRQISGKEVEDRIAKYSTVYGDVLLGLHGELEGLRRQVSGQESDLKRVQGRCSRLEQQGADLQIQIGGILDRTSEVERTAARLEQQFGNRGGPNDTGSAPLPSMTSAEDLRRELEAQRSALRWVLRVAVLAVILALGLGVGEWILG
jgi:chromosome segregation ATPase